MDIGPRNTRSIRKIKTFLIDLNLDLSNIDSAMKQHNDIIFDKIFFYVIAIEDKRFLQHRGIDYKSILRELWRMIRLKKHGGASTIDMQMIRTITDFKNKTIYRKIYEMILAFIINYRYSKRQIIDCYLRHAFFGSQIYGIKKVTQFIYQEQYLHNLKDYERAFIASMLLSPKPLYASLSWINKTTNRSVYSKKILSSIKDKLYEF